MKRYNSLLVILVIISFFTTSCGSSYVFIITPTIVTITPVVTILPYEIAVMNLVSTINQDGSIKTIAELSISPIGTGKLEIVAPSHMEIGETQVVKLTIAPQNAPAITPTAYPIPNNVLERFQEQKDYEATQQILVEIYPVMTAELVSDGFTIISDNRNQKAITSDSIIQWLWTITANKWGKQILLLSISTPVLIDENRNIVSSNEIKTLPIEILVRETATPTTIPFPTSTVTQIPTFTPTPIPISERIREQLVTGSDTIFVAVIGLIGTLLTAYVIYITNKKKQGDIGTSKPKPKKK